MSPKIRSDQVFIGDKGSMGALLRAYKIYIYYSVADLTVTLICTFLIALAAGSFAVVTSSQEPSKEPDT